jgi:hypothetical protein
MKKLIQWLKAVNQNAKTRAELILKARKHLGNMDEPWRAVNTSNDDVAVLLMRIGYAHIEAVYQGQMAAERLITRAQARVNQAAAHLN